MTTASPKNKPRKRRHRVSLTGKLLTPSGQISQAKIVCHPNKHAIMQACLQALATGQVWVTISWPTAKRLPKGFPRGKDYIHEGGKSVCLTKATHLLDWLREEGYTTLDKATIRDCVRRIDSVLNVFDERASNGTS